jgi:hypothetical protein
VNHSCATGINPTNAAPPSIPVGAPATPAQQDKIGKWYQVQFDTADGECLQIVMQMGESWTAPRVVGPLDGLLGGYGCQGRCGLGCPAAGSKSCSNYAEDCLRYDVCAWYHGSTNAAAGDCANEYALSVDDLRVPCLSSRTNRCQVNWANASHPSPAFA